MKIEFKAVFPQIQSAIKIDGGEGNCDRIQLDCYGLDINKVREIIGKEFQVIMTND